VSDTTLRTAGGDTVSRHLATERFESLEAQTDASQLGMWIFLVSEVLFFAALFTLYGAYRFAHPAAFADGVRHTDLFLGTANTYVLLTASFLVAVALHAVRHDRSGRAAALMAGAALLGVAFLVLKGLEYAHHFQEGLYPGFYLDAPGLPEPGFRVFFSLYYGMTGLHALHVLGGIVVLSWVAWRAHRGAYNRVYHTPLELGGMYWHFVDIVWLFLWPAFYLLR
jgi:cytochrome c oxidase subunit 3